MPLEDRPLRIAIDRGGTFTDCIATRPGQEDIVVKILSVDPNSYQDAPTEAIRRVLEIHRGCTIDRNSLLDLYDVYEIKLGTTVATNALLERKGERVAFFVTKGFRDLLKIGDQSRPNMFDPKINRRDVLYSDVWEIDERVTIDTWSESRLPIEPDFSDPAVVKGLTSEPIRIIEPINIESTKAKLMEAKEKGYTAIAICLMHSYTFRDHEKVVYELAKEIGFDSVSLSSEVSSMVGLVGRGHSVTADAYLTPAITNYISTFVKSFAPNTLDKVSCQFMQSDGGLVDFRGISGLRSVLSGPAGGVIGYSATCYDEEEKTPLIGFDMGGTSTDVSRFPGKLEHIFETVTSGVSIQTPQLDINTVAAGGGSILQWKHSLMCVGPESASSHPGPACYRKGGPLTVTDANLITGRLLLDNFPRIFGPNENEPLDYDASYKKFEEITAQINKDTGKNYSIFEIAEGFLTVANEAMCRPIRTLTEAKGHNASKHILCSFGGAGGQHACEIAQRLGISKVAIHKYSSLLSAHGIALADTVEDRQVPCSLTYSKENIPSFIKYLTALRKECEDVLLSGGFTNERIESIEYLNMKYKGSNTALMIEFDKDSDLIEQFSYLHKKEYGFVSANREIVVDTVRVRSSGKSPVEGEVSPLQEIKNYSFKEIKLDDYKITKTFLNGKTFSVPVLELGTLIPGDLVVGPALIVDKTQTLVIIPDARAHILKRSVFIEVPKASQAAASSAVDPIELSIFSHRFMGVAEQMGRSLQKSAVSNNIKERLDFTCSVFSPEGDLVANAPHVPAMIGSMAYAVKWQIDYWKDTLNPGDVIISNSPTAGGTHLPDITLITPVFDASGKTIIFWTASRGHHADIGGILPGSMPPNSTELWQEGAHIRAFKVVENGYFKEDELTKLLYDEPSQFDDCSGTRCLNDNISDIKAQIAANHKGVELIGGLIQEYTLDVVQMYMAEIQKSSEIAVQNLLREVCANCGSTELEAVDYMDDGTPICLKVSINPEKGTAVFDFTGTGPQVNGNWNAPIAITHSSVIFSLRCMVSGDIPLNQGCLAPITIKVPEGTLLRPDEAVAVCAGNVSTSQRLADVVFKAFNFSAASGGDMSNFTIGINGENGFGYYETICNGSGAGPSWHGTDGVHTNMTNTKITDSEDFERRYPAILRRFEINPGTGGKGKYHGGNGIIREVEFSIPMVAGILSERRIYAPYGMNGGEPGTKGRNYVVRKNGSLINVGGKSSIRVQKGDRFIIMTPGGGGYGSPDEVAEEVKPSSKFEFTPKGNGTVEIIRSVGEGN